MLSMDVIRVLEKTAPRAKAFAIMKEARFTSAR